MEYQRAQSQLLLSKQRDIRTVHATANTDNAVVIPIPPVITDSLGDRLHFTFAARIRMPVRQYILVIIVAIIAPTSVIERDVRVRRIHDAIRANLVRALRSNSHVSQFRLIVDRDALRIEY